jgi:hypothetical protein
MPFVNEILEGEITEQFREIAEAKTDPDSSETPPCSFPEACSEAGCRQSGDTGDCCTDDKKKKKKEYEQRAAGWFDPPVAHRL